MVTMTGKQLSLKDAKAAHAALSAIGWSHAQIERVIGRRCERCINGRGPRNRSGVCNRCAGPQARQLEVEVRCPGCPKVRRRVGAKVTISPCSRECRAYVRKCRESGVTP